METKQWSIHVEFLVIFVTLLGGCYMLKQDIDRSNARIDQVNCRIDQINVRTDQLYTMFIDLVKETKGNL